MKKVYRVISNGFIMSAGFSDEIKCVLKYGDTIYADGNDIDSQVCLFGMYSSGKWIDLSNSGNFVHFYKVKIDHHPSFLFIADCLELNILEDVTIKINRDNKLKGLGI